MGGTLIAFVADFTAARFQSSPACPYSQKLKLSTVSWLSLGRAYTRSLIGGSGPEASCVSRKFLVLG